MDEQFTDENRLEALAGDFKTLDDTQWDEDKENMLHSSDESIRENMESRMRSKIIENNGHLRNNISDIYTKDDPSCLEMLGSLNIMDSNCPWGEILDDLVLQFLVYVNCQLILTSSEDVNSLTPSPDHSPLTRSLTCQPSEVDPVSSFPCACARDKEAHDRQTQPHEEYACDKHCRVLPKRVTQKRKYEIDMDMEINFRAKRQRVSHALYMNDYDYPALVSTLGAETDNETNTTNGCQPFCDYSGTQNNRFP